jgi:hypothetical protein
MHHLRPGWSCLLDMPGMRWQQHAHLLGKSLHCTLNLAQMHQHRLRWSCQPDMLGIRERERAGSQHICTEL